MFRFYLIRTLRDIVGHIILIFLPVILISFFEFIYGAGILQMKLPNENLTTGLVLAIGFSLTFQIYGSSYSLEILGSDFLTPMHDRLLATPERPRKLVMSILFTSIIVSFLQTLMVILYSLFVLKIQFVLLPAILVVLLISVIFNQLFGSILLFLLKSVKNASSVIVLYGIAAPMIAGLYFPLPEGIASEIMKRYLTPMSLAQTAIYGIINKDYSDIIIGLAPIITLSILLFILIKPLSKRVIV